MTSAGRRALKAALTPRNARGPRRKERPHQVPQHRHGDSERPQVLGDGPSAAHVHANLVPPVSERSGQIPDVDLCTAEGSDRVIEYTTSIDPLPSAQPASPGLDLRTGGFAGALGVLPNGYRLARTPSIPPFVEAGCWALGLPNSTLRTVDIRLAKSSARRRCTSRSTDRSASSRSVHRTLPVRLTAPVELSPSHDDFSPSRTTLAVSNRISMSRNSVTFFT